MVMPSHTVYGFHESQSLVKAKQFISKHEQFLGQAPMTLSHPSRAVVDKIVALTGKSTW